MPALRPLVLFALAAACTMATAGAAVPAAAPAELTVTQTPAASSRTAAVDALLRVGGGAPAAVALYVPAGYTAAVAQAPGTKLADAAARFLVGGAAVIGRGTVTSDDPAKYIANSCAPGPHEAVWVVTLALSGQTVSIPFFVDAASPDTATEVAFVARACLDPPATSGRQLDALELNFPSLFHSPAAPGLYVWRTVVMPYGADGTPDAVGAVEAQALVPLPHRVRARARYDRRRRRVTITGVAVAGRHGDSGSTVTVLAETTGGKAKTFATAKTGPTGRFSLTRSLRRTTTFALRVGTELFGDGECEPTVGPAPCSHETIAPSDKLLLKVKVPATRTPRR